MATASVILGHDSATREPVILDDEARTHGLYIIGKNGTGKSTLLLNMVVEDIESGKGICLLDPHGDLTDDVLQRIPMNRRKDVLYLDAGNSTQPFGLNLFSSTGLSDEPLRSRRVNQIVMAFRKAFARYDFGITVATMLRNIAYVFVRHEGMKIFSDIPTFLTERDFRGRLLAPITNTLIRSYWKDFDILSDRDRVEMIRPLMSRLSEILTDDLLLGILDQEETSVDFRRAMDEEKIVLVRLPVSKLDEVPVSLLGTMIVGQLLTAAFSRGELQRNDRKMFCIYADEFHRFATEDFGTFFNEARKYGVALTIAHQELGQIDDMKIAAAVMGAESLVVFSVSGDDAIQLAKEFSHEPPEREITGYRPKQTPSVTVVEDIVRKGHPSRTVKAAAETYFAPFLRHPDDQRQEFRMSFPQYAGEYSGWDVHRGVEALNRHFYAAMHVDKQEKVRSITWASPDLVAATNHLRHALGVGWILKELTPEDYEDFAHPGTGTHPRWEEFTGGKPRSADALTVIPFDLWLARQLANDIIAARDEEAKPSSRESYFGQGVRLRQFMRAMTRVWIAVFETPVMSTGTEEEPIYGPTRPYADIENEITTKLANLPRFTAKVKVSNGEWTILTPGPPRIVGQFIPEMSWERRQAVTPTVEPQQEKLTPVNQRRIPQRDR